MSAMPPRMSPTAARFLGRTALAASLTNAPGSVTAFVTPETMFPRKLMAAPFPASGGDARVGGGGRGGDGGSSRRFIRARFARQRLADLATHEEQLRLVG